MIKAAGAIFLSKKTKRVLLNFRSKHVSKGATFGFWGGKLEHNESTLDGLTREIKEECGYLPDYKNIYPLDVYISKDTEFQYFSFLIVVDKEFIPKLNNESDGYLWCNLASFPRQLHVGAKVILENQSFVSNILRISEY